MSPNGIPPQSAGCSETLRGSMNRPRGAGVPPAGSPSVSLGVGTGGETPPEPAAEDGCGTVALVHGPDVHPILEVAASYDLSAKAASRTGWPRVFLKTLGAVLPLRSIGWRERAGVR